MRESNSFDLDARQHLRPAQQLGYQRNMGKVFDGIQTEERLPHVFSVATAP
jgi:hypothetical protein